MRVLLSKTWFLVLVAAISVLLTTMAIWNRATIFQLQVIRQMDDRYRGADARRDFAIVEKRLQRLEERIQHLEEEEKVK